jgi:preprotein translocase subunit SecE
VSTETAAPTPAAGGSGARSGRGGRDASKKRRGPFSRIATYWREVIEQLSKVIRPSRQELITYVIVVVVFVTFMVTLVAGIDYGVTRLILRVFG